MTAHEIWLICFSVATPVAGVVAFMIQIHTVRKIRLENEKLKLELGKLREEEKQRERSIRIASILETERYGSYDDDQPMFSRSRSGMIPSYSLRPKYNLLRSFLSATFLVLLIVAFVAFVTYLGFDIYRLLRWASSDI